MVQGLSERGAKNVKKETKGSEEEMTKKKTTMEKTANRMAKTCANFYDKALVDRLMAGTSLFYSGKFRNKRVPKYLWLTIPVIERHFDYEYGDYEGLIITTRKIRLFKIGTKVIKVPVWRKFKQVQEVW